MGLATAISRLGVFAVCVALLVGCHTDNPGNSGDDGDCTSQYENVVTAPTLAKLEVRLNALRPHGKRMQFTGTVDGKRTYRLRNSKGRTAGIFEAWRLDDGSWTAGQWSQCIDS